MALVESSGRYYLWNITSNVLFLIEEPAQLTDILARVHGENKDWQLRLTEVEVIIPSSEPSVELDPYTKALVEKNEGRRRDLTAWLHMLGA